MFIILRKLNSNRPEFQQ